MGTARFCDIHEQFADDPLAQKMEGIRSDASAFDTSVPNVRESTPSVDAKSLPGLGFASKAARVIGHPPIVRKHLLPAANRLSRFRK